MLKDLRYYIKKFSNLRVDRARGVAPHKPILLLAIIELIAQSSIRKNQIYPTPELISTFHKYWTHLGSSSHHSSIHLPFFHLKSEGFWHLLPNPGFEAAVSKGTQPKSVAALRDAVKYASFDQELFQLLQESDARPVLISALTQKWFSEKTENINQLLNINAFEEEVKALEAVQLKLFEKKDAVYRVDEINDEEKAIVRNAAFRKNIVKIYEHRCAICRLKIIDHNGQNIVDGAHIKPFAEFYDDRFDNGLSLCKNHHWAFDHGWFGITDDYKILVPHERLHEEVPADTKAMRDFHGEKILLPAQEMYNPRISSLQWHRENLNIA